MPIALDRPGRAFLMPERSAVMWRAVDSSNPATVIGVGVELTALAALEGQRALDGARAAQAFANHIVDIEACASARFNAGPGEQRVLVLTADDLAEAIARQRLHRMMECVTHGP